MKQLLFLQKENQTQLPGYFPSLGMGTHYAKCVMPRLAPPPGTVTNIIQEISSPKIPLHAVCFKIIKTVSQHMILGSLQHFKHTEWRKTNNTSKKATMS